jgi:trimeric autotransporter adhesin
MHFRARLALGTFLVHSIGLGQVITTEVGTDPPGFVSPQAAASTPLGQLFAIASDKSGNLYIADSDRAQVFKLTPAGSLTLIAGNGFAGFSGDNGLAVNASLKFPQGVTVGSDGAVYIGDSGNDRVRKVATDGTITTFAGNGSEVFSGDGGQATGASLDFPAGLSFDSAGDLYVTDTRHNRIRKISTSGIINTVAGNGVAGYNGEGPATSAKLNTPSGVALDAAGNLYIADTQNHRIRKVANGVISTFAGTGTPGFLDGPAATADFGFPKGVTFDGSGNLFVADAGNNRVRKISSNVVSTVAGNGAFTFAGDGGKPLSASLAHPSSIAFDGSGNIFIADTTNNRIRLVNAANTSISTLAGNGLFRQTTNGTTALQTLLSNPQDVKVGPDGLLYIADAQANRVLRVNADNTVVTVAGNGQFGFSGDGQAATNATLYIPRHLTFDTSGNLYIADTQNLRIRRVTPQGIISTVAGNGQGGYSGDNGPAVNATLNFPTDVALDSAGNIYIADQQNHVVRVVKNGTISTFAGNGTAGFQGDEVPANSTSLNGPYSIAVDSADVVYIADTFNSRVRKVTKDGIIHAVAGTGVGGYTGDGGPATAAQFNNPAGLFIAVSGDLFIADSVNAAIRVVHPDQTVETVAGNGTPGYSGDGGPATAATLNRPVGVALDSQGGLHVADSLNNRIRFVPPALPSFNTTPTSLEFTALAGGAVTAPQSLQASSPLTGLPFNVSLSDPWLKASINGGNMPATVAISVDPSQLGAGNYKGTVTITAPQSSTPASTINVSASIGLGAAAKITVNKASLDFAFTQGATPGQSSLTVTNTGGGTLTFNAAASTSRGGQWLKVFPTSGTVTPNSAVSLNVTATPGALAVGSYTGTIALTSNTAGQAKVPVTMALSPSVAKILVSQTGLTFTGVSQGGSVLPQSIGILNLGAGVMHWTAQANTLTGSGWLSLSANSGVVNRPFLDVSFLNISVNASSLAAGTYYGSVQVGASEADNAPQTVLVVLNVLPPGSNPGPEVSPTGLVFTGVSGAENPGSQNVSVANVTANPLQYGSSAAFVTDSNWFAYSPNNATVDPNTPVSIVVQPQITNLPAGVRFAVLTLALSDQSSRTISVLSVVAPPGTSTGAATRAEARPLSPAVTGCQATKLSPQFTQLGAGRAVSAGWPVALIASVVDDCGAPMTQGSVVASFSNGDPPLSMISLQNGQWSSTWQPGNANPGGVTVTLDAQTPPSLAGKTQTTIGVQGNEQLPTGGVINAVSVSQGPLAPGELILIKGSALANGKQSSSSSPLPQQLAGASVVLGGRYTPLLYADSSQIVAVVPPDLPPNSSQQILLVRENSTGIPSPVIVSTTQPSVFTEDGSGKGQALAYKGGVLADASHPVKAGDQVVIYSAGLGTVDAQGAVTNPVQLTIGGQTAQVSYAGVALSSQFPAGGPPAILGVSTGLGGLYQIAATVPSGLTGGAAAIVLSSSDQESQSGVTLSVAGGSVSTPVVAAVVNGASFLQGGIVPGELATIFGTNLTSADGINPATAIPLPTTILKASALINGSLVPLFAVDNVNGQQQFNFQVPWDVDPTAPAAIAVSNDGVTGAPISAPVLAAQPGIFAYQVGGNTFGAILNTSFQLTDAAHPVHGGDIIIIYCTGLGAVVSPPANGAAGNGQVTVNTPTLTIGGANSPVKFSGLAPGFVGLYQINAEVPLGLAGGNQPVVLKMLGVSSNSVLVPVN